jgi:hypothetical protein
LSESFHLTNGDATALPLRVSGVPGEVGVWADVLHEGPVPDGVEGVALRELRARHAVRAGYADAGEARALQESWEGDLQSAMRAGEAVIWLEHDLFDQLLLIHHLHRFLRGNGGDGGGALHLICIDEFPGVELFQGLGQLSPAQLASLYPERVRVTATQLQQGDMAWRAFTADDPRGLFEFAQRDVPGLPHLKPALRRLLEEYPSVRDGLARTERQVLHAVAAGADTPTAAFRAAQELEEARFHGDAVFWSIARRLGSGSRRLLQISDETPRAGTLPQARLTVTERGRAVLAGRDDAIRMRGIDRWIGGVRLKGEEAAWRWDGANGRLLATRHSPDASP